MEANEKVAHAEAIAKALGATYTERGDGNGQGYITMPDGVTFWLSVGGWSGRYKVHVGTNYPQHYTGANRTNGTDRYLTTTSQRDFDRELTYNSPTFSGINLTVDKTPEQAAKDILRRFLPTYAPLYAKALEYCAQQAAYLDRWEANYKAANKAAQGTSGLTVDYIGGDYVQFKLSVCPEDVEKVAAFARSLHAS